MNIERLNELAVVAHNTAKEKGFYDKPRSLKTALMLIISEVAETVEADRKNRRANPEMYKAQIGAMGQMAAYEKYIKDSLEAELAGTAIRLLDLCGYMGWEIQEGDLDAVKQQNSVEISEHLFDLVVVISGIETSVEWGIDSMTRAQTWSTLFHIAEDMLKIDLMYYIETEMAYNALRPYKHGKQY